MAQDCTGGKSHIPELSRPIFNTFNCYLFTLSVICLRHLVISILKETYWIIYSNCIFKICMVYVWMIMMMMMMIMMIIDVLRPLLCTW